MLKTVPPYISNLGKRLVKSPKIYLSDTGITATLLGLRNYETIIGHSAFGSLWEQMVLNNLMGHFPNAEFYFYRTTGGAEMDFVMLLYGKVYAVECKASLSPKLSVGNFYAIEDISPEQTFVVIPANSSENWTMKNGIEVVSLTGLVAKLGEKN
jgi:predicted AAA+ superfamily ATPase